MSAKITQDNFGDFIAAVNELNSYEVLVGVPEDENERKGADEMNNATLAAIMNNGSPLQNIPARPYLYQGVSENRDLFIEDLRKLALACMDRPAYARKHIKAGLERIAQTAESKVKMKLKQGPWTPLADSTLRARARAVKGRKGALRELAARQAKANGVEIAGPPTQDPNVRPLIDTAQLLNATTGLVAKKDEIETFALKEELGNVIRRDDAAKRKFSK